MAEAALTGAGGSAEKEAEGEAEGGAGEGEAAAALPHPKVTLMEATMGPRKAATEPVPPSVSASLRRRERASVSALLGSSR